MTGNDCLHLALGFSRGAIAFAEQHQAVNDVVDYLIAV
jgi:hypothetical protein